MLSLLSFHRLLLWLLAAFIATGVGLYFRLYPLTHNISSDAYEQGTMLVITKIRASIAGQISRQFPDMPTSQKEQLAKKQFDKTLKEHGSEIRQAFDQAGQKILEHSGESQHYLLASDSYYYLALTQELLEKGSFGTKSEGSKFFNNFMLAPLGYWQPQTWHPYLGALSYKIVRFFKPDSSLMFGVGFTSVFLFPIVLAAFFLTCRALGCGAFPSFIASIFFVLAPIYLQRSTFAWFDDDAYNVFFPLIIFYCLFKSIDHYHNIKKLLIYASLTAIVMALYSRFWYGWGFIWALSAGAIGLSTFLSFNKNKDSFKPSLILTTALVITPFIAVGLMCGFGEVWQILSFASGELKKFIAPSLKTWPDLFIVVGELKKCSLRDVVNLTGGQIIFCGGLLTVLWNTRKAFIRYDSNAAKTTLLTLFFAFTLFLSINAQRFTILCLTPLALLFAYGLNQLWLTRNQLTEACGLKTTALKRTFTGIFAGILLLSLSLPIISSQKNIRALLSPIFNSAWERALVKLRDHSPTNSVINTWWSPGHFVKAIANRRVTFDGATINGEQAYWLTRVYLSQSENEALGILRMLNISSNSATEYLQRKNIPLSIAVPLITQATLLNRDNAFKLYAQTLSNQDAQELIFMTHGEPPPSYILIYNEIVDGNVMLGYLGKWNFKKIEELNKNPETLKKIPSKNSKNYVDFIWSLVGGPYRQSPTLNPVALNKDTILFDQGVAINTNDMTVSIQSASYGSGVPLSILYADGNKITEKTFSDANLSYSVVYFKDPNGAPRCVLLDRMIANSLLARMYYFEGLGLHHFKPFSKESDLTGRTKIFIYEVTW